MIETLIAILFATYFVYRLLIKSKPSNFPPGPPSVPFLGSLPFLPKGKGVLGFAADEITKKYGKLVGLHLGPYLAICVYDYEIAKEMLAMEEASGRPNVFWNNIRMLDKRLGVLFNDNDAYRNQRRFIHRTLRDFGFGKASLENILLSEADHIMEHFNSLNGSPVQPQLVFNVGVLNIIWKIVADKRYDLTDARMLRLFQLINSTTALGKQKLLLTFPFLRFIFPKMTGWTEQKEMVKQLHSTMSEVLNDHKKTYDEDSMRNLTDVYLKQIKESNDPSFNEEQFSVILMDLFLAGAETTSTTLTWSLINLMKYPEKQKKIHDEIDNILGDTEISSNYRGRLLYTDAFILETLRVASIVPMSVPHRAKQTFEIRGHTIPKDTIIYPQLRYMMRDPDYWKNPEEFDPERFITKTDDGKSILAKKERLVPFGLGKRVCLGESLARQELFLIFTKMLQKFKIEAVDGEELPNENDASRGIIHCPPKFNVRFIQRQKAT